MPAKKKQRNGFFYFMKDQIEVYRKQGKLFDMTTIVPIAHPKWQDLSSEEREQYNNYAKTWKKQQKEQDKDGRLDSLGCLVKEVKADEQQQEQRADNRNMHVRELIGGMNTMDEVAVMKFYLINFNIFCTTQEGEVIPAEVALVEYSIQEGITNEYHTFIHPGAIPTGYAYVARQHSEDTHKIPSQNFELADNNYMLIYNHMKQLVKSRGQAKYPVYCLQEEIEQTEGALDWLASRALARAHDQFEVFDLSRLLLEFCRFANIHRGLDFVDSPALMKDWLTKCSFNHVPNISCHWHEAEDASSYCSFSVVKCFCFLMSERVCPMYNVEMIVDCHLPLRASSLTTDVLDWSKLKIKSKRSEQNMPAKDHLSAPSSSSNRYAKELPQSCILKSTASGEGSTIVQNHRSKFRDLTEDRVYVPGATSGVITEHNPRSNVALSTGCFQPKKKEFEMSEDDFPPMQSPALGRGRGSGSSKNLPTTSTSTRAGVGFGRGSGFKNLLQ